MVETRIESLDGESIRSGGETWTFTGDLEVKQNGDALTAIARKSERVRGNRGSLKFSLVDGASLNPGNLGDVDVTLERDGGTPVLAVRRPHGTSRYELTSVRYD